MLQESRPSRANVTLEVNIEILSRFGDIMLSAAIVRRRYHVFFSLAMAVLRRTAGLKTALTGGSRASSRS